MTQDQINALILIVVILIVMIAAVTFLILITQKSNKNKGQSNGQKGKKKGSLDDLKKESIYSFMDFDEIKDNMIIRKKRKSICYGFTM